MAAPDAEAPGGEQGQITRRAGVVALGTLASRLLGAVRDAVIAASFSLAATDAFFVAWTIPNTLRRLLGEGAVSAAFIPVFSELDAREGESRARRYMQAFSGAMLLLLTAVSLVGVATAPLWSTLYAAGYRGHGDKFDLTVELTRLLFPYILLAGLAALWTGALNARGRFLVPAFAPALLNLSLIASPLLFVPVALSLGLSPIAGLALGALLGGVLQAAVQLPALGRVGLSARPSLALSDPAVRRSFLLMAPLLLGTGVHQLNILLSRLLASFLPHGSQSFLYYGQRLVEIPQGMFAMAIASAALPSLARLRSQERSEEATAAFRHSLALSLFIAVPASVALSVLALPTVTVVFGRGEFGPVESELTARSLVWLAAGVWIVSATHAVTRMYFAYNDTRTPVLCGLVNLATFVAVSLQWMASMGHVAIALGTTCGAAAQLLILLVLLPRRVGPVGFAGLGASLLRQGLSAAAMALVVTDLAAVGRWDRGGNDPRNLAVYAGTLVLGACVYLAMSYLLGSRELPALWSVLRRRP